MAEQRTYNSLVVGSNPSGSTILAAWATLLLFCLTGCSHNHYLAKQDTKSIWEAIEESHWQELGEFIATSLARSSTPEGAAYKIKAKVISEYDSKAWKEVLTGVAVAVGERSEVSQGYFEKFAKTLLEGV